MGATQALVVDLVEVYFEIVYPIFPFFHKPTFSRKVWEARHESWLRSIDVRQISRADYHHDRNLFASTMAICALASARVRDQALYNPTWDVQELSGTHSETFYNAAVYACTGAEAAQSQNLNALRALALLSLTAIQYGRIREMQEHLGRYHTLVAMDSLHDELNWPQDIGIVEREERRRLVRVRNLVPFYADKQSSGRSIHSKSTRR